MPVTAAGSSCRTGCACKPCNQYVSRPLLVLVKCTILVCRLMHTHCLPLFLQVAPGHVNNYGWNDREYQGGKHCVPDTKAVDNMRALEIAESSKYKHKHNS